jgi:hypothetical protein
VQLPALTPEVPPLNVCAATARRESALNRLRITIKAARGKTAWLTLYRLGNGQRALASPGRDRSPLHNGGISDEARRSLSPGVNAHLSERTKLFLLFQHTPACRHGVVKILLFALATELPIVDERCAFIELAPFGPIVMIRS